MEVRLVIDHREANNATLLGELERVFGRNDKDSVLQRSHLYYANPGQPNPWLALVLFAVQRPSYRLICLPTTSTELQVVVEPEGEDARAAAKSAWNGIRNALTHWSPQLQRGEITDSSQTFLTAHTRVRSHMGRPDSRIAIVIGVGNLLWCGIALLSFAKNEYVDLVIGGAPALLAAAVFVVDAFWSTKKGDLAWKMG